VERHEEFGKAHGKREGPTTHLRRVSKFKCDTSKLYVRESVRGEGRGERGCVGHTPKWDVSGRGMVV
jgi:hypothetical protein